MSASVITAPPKNRSSHSNAAGTAALEMIDVSKSYGSVQALRPTSFRVEQGELLTLLGPSGSGKTTLLGLAAGIVDPDEGRILFHGKDVTDLPTHERGIGMVFQRYTLFPNKTVAENVAFPLRVRKRPAKEIDERVCHFLDLVALTKEADRYPSQISGGQAQRVALARALVFEPAVLLMDEPLGALDRRLRQTLQDEVRRIQRATKVPTLYVTHDQEEAMHLSDRIAVVRDGGIAELGPPRQVYERPANHWIAAFLGDVNSCSVQRWSAVDEGTVLADLGEIGRAQARNYTSMPAGAPAQFIVRPERCRISPESTQETNSFAGVVTDTTYLGSTQRIRVTVQGNWSVFGVCSSHLQTLEAGQSAYLEFDADAAAIVPE